LTRNLVVVESPAKAKTIGRYLGKDYSVLASMGHVRDLPKSDFAVEFHDGVDVTYEVTPKAKKVVSDIRKAAKAAEQVFQTPTARARRSRGTSPRRPSSARRPRAG
jgi:DNA topoisomerase I